MLKSLRKVVLHPALFFELGNLALAFGFATYLAIGLNAGLVLAVLVSRILSVVKKKTYDISYLLLAGVGLFTAGSVIYKAQTDDGLEASSILAALTYIFWAVGYLCSLYLERKKQRAGSFLVNPQFHFGIGDMLVVNVQGTLNPYSFPFTVIGFVKSLFVGRAKHIRNKRWRKVYGEVSSARIYAAGFFIGAVSLITIPHLVIAQVCWGLAYLQYGKDS